MPLKISDLMTEPDERSPSKYYGFYCGLVTNNEDPEKLGRCKIHFPWFHEPGDESNWARHAYPMGGPGRGFWFIPEVDDEVLVGFEHGDIRAPYIVGSLYNGKDRPPSLGEEGSKDFNQDGNNDLRAMKSRSGHQFLFHDGGSCVKLNDKKGNILHLDTDKDDVLKTANQNVKVKAKGANANYRASAGSIIMKAGVDIIWEAGADISTDSQANTKFEAGAKFDATSGSPMTISSKATLDEKSAGAMSYKSNANLSQASTGPHAITAGATYDGKAGSNMSIGSKATMGMKASANFSAKAGASIKGGGKANLSLGAGGQAGIKGSEATVGAKGMASVIGGLVMMQGALVQNNC